MLHIYHSLHFYSEKIRSTIEMKINLLLYYKRKSSTKAMKNKIFFFLALALVPSLSKQNGCCDTAYMGADFGVEIEACKLRSKSASKTLERDFAISQTENKDPENFLPPQIKAYLYRMNLLSGNRTHIGPSFAIFLGYAKRVSCVSAITFEVRGGYDHKPYEIAYPSTSIEEIDGANGRIIDSHSHVKVKTGPKLGFLVGYEMDIRCLPGGKIGFQVGMEWKSEKLSFKRPHPIQDQNEDPDVQKKAAIIYQTGKASKFSPAFHIRASIKSFVGGANSKWMMGLYVGGKFGGKTTFNFKNVNYAPTTYSVDNTNPRKPIYSSQPSIDNPLKITKHRHSFEAGLTLEYRFR